MLRKRTEFQYFFGQFSKLQKSIDPSLEDEELAHKKNLLHSVSATREFSVEDFQRMSVRLSSVTLSRQILRGIFKNMHL